MRRTIEGLRSLHGQTVLALVYTGLVLTTLEYYYLTTRVQKRLGLGPGVSLEAGVTWAVATIVGFLVLPALIVVFVHREPLSSIGWSLRGFRRHIWIYLGLYVLVFPFLLFAGRQPAFLNMYPFVAEATRDWTIFAIWEAFYLFQFMAVEAFFRGYLVFTLEKAMGWHAIFAMAVPCCMIHYHKPVLEAYGALFSAILLGALALRLRSFLGGVVLHCLVGLTMDLFGARHHGLF